MTKYQKAKAAAREKAVEFSNTPDATAGMSWAEVAAISNHFERLGRRYGLLREFRENGIC